MFDKDAKVLSARIEFLDFYLRSPSSLDNNNSYKFTAFSQYLKKNVVIKPLELHPETELNMVERKVSLCLRGRRKPTARVRSVTIKLNTEILLKLQEDVQRKRRVKHLQCLSKNFLNLESSLFSPYKRTFWDTRVIRLTHFRLYLLSAGVSTRLCDI